MKAAYAPSMMDVLREAELAKKLPIRPVGVEIGAMFARLPHVDPKKEADARETDLRTMSRTLIDVWAEEGQRPHEVVEKLQRVVDLLDEVSDGMGHAYLVNMLQMTGSDALATVESGSSSTKSTAVAV